MEPVSGVAFMNFVAVVNEAPHPNGAKLLIRYLLGGEMETEMVSNHSTPSEDGRYARRQPRQKAISPWRI